MENDVRRRHQRLQDLQQGSCMVEDEPDSEQRYLEMLKGSSPLEQEPDYVQVNGSDLFTNSDEDASRLFRGFHCSTIETPRLIVEFEKNSAEIQNALNILIKNIHTINQKGNSDKADGSAVSFMGGLLGIGGTVLAPFTVGTALALTGVGMVMSVGGSLESSKAGSNLKKEMNDSLSQGQAWLTMFNNRILEWITVAKDLQEIVEELQGVFKELSFSFSHLVGSIGNVKYEDTSSYQVECILKCASNFYGVVKHSTKVVRNVQQITRLTLRFEQVRTIIYVGKRVGELANAGKGVFLSAAIGKIQFASSVAKSVVAKGNQVVSVAEKTVRLSQSAKLVTTVADGTVKVVQTETALQALGTSVTKETVKANKTISRVGLALGIIFTAIDFYEFDKAVTASERTCKAERELRSCVTDIEKSTQEVKDQIETYKQVVKIKAFFQSLFDVDKPVVFEGVQMPFERLQQCIHKIDKLVQKMS